MQTQPWTGSILSETVSRENVFKLTLNPITMNLARNLECMDYFLVVDMLPKFLFVNSDHTTQAYTEQLLGSHSWGEDSVESVRGQSAETINSKISALLRVI